MKYLLILLLFNIPLFHFHEAGKVFSYEVEAKNGGLDGYNNVKCDCNQVTQVYKSLYSEPGYEKFQHCCLDVLPKKVIPLINQCDTLVLHVTDTAGILKSEGYQAKFDIKDKLNFKYTITRSN